MPDVDEQLAVLAGDIAACMVCDSQAITVEHSGPMMRGYGREFMIVGVQPGGTEVRTSEAFSGPAGRRLMEWLARANLAADRAAAMKCGYMTSICKCKVRDDRKFAKAARNCLPFLQRQIATVQPKLMITLGLEPVRFLFGYSGSFEAIACQIWTERQLYDGLFPNLPEQTPIVPLPHPSPLSRWLNSEAHKTQLDVILSRIRNELL